MNLSQKLGLLAIPCLVGFFIWPQFPWLIYLGGTFAVIGFAGSANYVFRGNRDALRRWRKTGRVDSIFVEDAPKQKE